MLNGSPKHRTREGFIITDGKHITLVLYPLTFEQRKALGEAPLLILTELHPLKEEMGRKGLLSL